MGSDTEWECGTEIIEKIIERDTGGVGELRGLQTEGWVTEEVWDSGS